MCGRYVLYGPITRLQKQMGLVACPEWTPRYNIAPQSDILVIRARPDVGRVGQIVRWGLIPFWAKDPAIGAKLTNARAEGIADKPSFRSSFARHRCLIPADGFYEWASISDPAGKSRKQPYYFHPTAADSVFAFAGLLSHWVGPDGDGLVTACLITTSANETVSPVHDRMQVILAAQDFDRWLDSAHQDIGARKSLLRPARTSAIACHPVSPAVSRAGNEGEGLILPLAPAAMAHPPSI